MIDPGTSHAGRLQVRRAVSSDTEAVLELIPRLLAFGPPPWRNLSEMADTDLGVIGNALKSKTDDPVIYVAERNDKILGFIHLHSTTDYYRKRRHGHVADIVVAASAEGQGIGRRLLAVAESWARKSSFDWLSISAFESNVRALSLYEDAGFNRDIVRLIKALPDADVSGADNLKRDCPGA